MKGKPQRQPAEDGRTNQRKHHRSRSRRPLEPVFCDRFRRLGGEGVRLIYQGDSKNDRLDA